MSSSYTGNPTTAADSLTLMTGGDRKTAQSARVPLERLLDNSAREALRRLESDVLTLRSIWSYAVTITDTAESVAASAARNPLGSGPDSPVLIVKTAQCFKVGCADFLTAQGVPPSITSLVTDAAHGNVSHNRLLVIGTGGNRNAFSDDAGASWTAGGDIGATPKRLIFNDSQFMCTQGADRVSRSTNGVTWTANTSAGVVIAGGLASYSNGNVVALGSLTGTVRWTDDNGATFSSVANIPNAGSLDGDGSVAGNCGSRVFHVGSIDSGAQLQISSSASNDGTDWNVVATIDAPAGDAFAAEPRLLMCRTTGVLVIVAPLAGSSVASARCALYASRGDWVVQEGSDFRMAWTRERLMQTDPDPGVDAFALAGGKLIMAINDQLFASAGAGEE